jgi:hypothetical protein
MSNVDDDNHAVTENAQKGLRTTATVTTTTAANNFQKATTTGLRSSRLELGLSPTNGLSWSLQKLSIGQTTIDLQHGLGPSKRATVTTQ